MADAALLDLAKTFMPDLTAAEIAVVEAAAGGHDHAFPDQTDIRAALIRWLCADAKAKALVEPRGLRISNARIAGELDLRNISIEFLLRLHRCLIDGDVNLTDARVRSIGFRGTKCRDFQASRAVVNGNIFLDPEDGQRLECERLILDDASVSGSVVANRLRAAPEVTRLSAQGPAAVSLDRTSIQGTLFLEQARIEGSLGASDGRFGAILARKITIHAQPSGRPYALSVVRSTVTGSLVLAHEETVVVGPIWLFGSAIGGSLDLTGMHVSALPGAAPPWPVLVDLSLARVGEHVRLGRVLVENGRVVIWDAEMGQDLDLSDIRLCRDEASDDAHAEPQADIAVVGTRIGKALWWHPLSLPDRVAVAFSRSTAQRLEHGSLPYWPREARVWLDAFHYSAIDTDVPYRFPRLAGPARWLKAHQVPGWRGLPRRLALRAANRVAGADTTRLGWLRGYTRRSYDAGAYDTLAAALRSMGKDQEAVRVLIARANDRRRARGPVAVLLGLPYRWLVGNGLRAWRAVLWIALLTLVGAVVASHGYHAGELVAVKTAKETVPFQPVVYSLDVLLPIIDLGQATAYLPTAPAAAGLRAFLWVQMCLGWLLATALVASAGAALQRRAQ